jgi:DNA-binding LytR/AlgR family response regulator
MQWGQKLSVLAVDGEVAVPEKYRTRYVIHVTITERERLDPARFLRVHRSYVVKPDCIGAILGEPEGRLTIQMRDGARLNTGRSRVRALKGIGL